MRGKCVGMGAHKGGATEAQADEAMHVALVKSHGCVCQSTQRNAGRHVQRTRQQRKARRMCSLGASARTLIMLVTHCTAVHEHASRGEQPHAGTAPKIEKCMHDGPESCCLDKIIIQDSSRAYLHALIVVMLRLNKASRKVTAQDRLQNEGSPKNHLQITRSNNLDAKADFVGAVRPG